MTFLAVGPPNPVRSRPGRMPRRELAGYWPNGLRLVSFGTVSAGNLRLTRQPWLTPRFFVAGPAIKAIWVPCQRSFNWQSTAFVMRGLRVRLPPLALAGRTAGVVPGLPNSSPIHRQFIAPQGLKPIAKRVGVRGSPTPGFPTPPPVSQHPVSQHPYSRDERRSTQSQNLMHCPLEQ